VRAKALALASLGLLGCPAEPELAPLDRLALPTGLAITPDARWLLISNGNWNRAFASSSLVALDLAALDAALLDVQTSDAELTRARPCRRDAEADDELVECEAALLIDPALGVRVPSGAGNLALDRPLGPAGPLRVLMPTRLAPSVTWVDAFGPGYGAGPDDPALRLDCSHDEQRTCSLASRVGVVGDPARLSIDDDGYRYAYLPHLVDQQLSLLALDGPEGPHVVDVELQFFREDGLFESGLGGGFAVAQRPCSAAAPPLDSLDCTRPLLFASQRFWPGIRQFQVAAGLDVIIPGSESAIAGPNLESAEPRPLMAGLAFEDPAGERLLVVHTTPPALLRVDTSLDEAGEPRLAELGLLDLCNNPNMLVVHRPASGPALALISCFADAELAVVDLELFAQIATIAVGEGPNELLIEPERDWLLVANTVESSISIIELSRLRELVRLR
jgi:hypothetical protein